MNVFSKSANLSVSETISSPESSDFTPMDYSSSLRCLCSISNSPLPHLIRPRRKEATEIKHLPHGRNNLGQGGLCTELFTFLLCLRLSLETCEALLESDGERQYRIAWSVFFDPLSDLRKMLVLLSDVILFAEIDEINNGFGAEKEERIYNLDLVNRSNQRCSER